MSAHHLSTIKDPDILAWNDMPPAEQKMKKMVIGVLSAITIILIVGAVVGSYFCFTTSSGGTSNAVLSVLPITFGGTFSLVLIITLVVLGCLWTPYQDDRFADEVRIKLYRTQNVKDAYQEYENKIGASLLRKEILSIDQARDLRDIFEKYREISPVLKNFDRLTSADQTHISTHLNEYPHYKDAFTIETELNSRWLNIHTQVFPTNPEEHAVS